MSNRAWSTLGKPTIEPLACNLVLPIPLTSRLGISMRFSLPETVLLISKIPFGLLANGLVVANCGAKTSRSLKPNRLFFKLAFIDSSPGFLLNAAIEG